MPLRRCTCWCVYPSTKVWDLHVDMSFILQLLLTLSCGIAVGTNLSQFICIGRFTAVSFQVLGHMKTILVLILGFLFFGKEGLNLHVVIGMIIAIVGMIWYSNASSKPGGKERRSHSISKSGGSSESSDADEKVWVWVKLYSHTLEVFNIGWIADTHTLKFPKSNNTQ